MWIIICIKNTANLTGWCNIENSDSFAASQKERQKKNQNNIGKKANQRISAKI